MTESSNPQTSQESIVTIGKILMSIAKESGQPWDYSGWMFETTDGVNSTGETFLYYNGQRLANEYSFDLQDAIIDAFKSLRESSHVSGDVYWIKCLAVLRHDGDMRVLFEFEDAKRWSITPRNFERGYEILIGEIYPEALSA